MTPIDRSRPARLPRSLADALPRRRRGRAAARRPPASAPLREDEIVEPRARRTPLRRARRRLAGRVPGRARVAGRGGLPHRRRAHRLAEPAAEAARRPQRRGLPPARRRALRLAAALHLARPRALPRGSRELPRARPGERVRTALVDFRRALLRIPNLAIHLQRELAQRGARSSTRSSTWRRCSASRTPRRSRSCWRASCGRPATASLEPGDLLGFDLMLYDAQPACVTGARGEFVSSPRLDNLVSCHAALTALSETARESLGAATRLVVLYDHEEVGSRSAQGAAGTLLADALERCVAGWKDGARQGLARAAARSWLVSADMAHAVHPNYADRHEPEHRPLIGKGPVIKVNADQPYASDAESAALFASLCGEVGVCPQHFVVRSDLACGSTIGPITAARVGIRTVDVGNPMLAMHSCRELAGSADVAPMIDVLGGPLPGRLTVGADFAPFAEKMRAEGLPEPAIRSFAHYYAALAAGARGTLSRREIEPVASVESAEELGELRRGRPRRARAHRRRQAERRARHDHGHARAPSRCCRVKRRAQLPRRDRAPGAPPAARPRLPRAAPPDEQLPHPRRLARRARQLPRPGGRPAPRLPPAQGAAHRGRRTWRRSRWPADPELEWCPPGHGDLYLALETSGLLARLLERGFRYAFVSNADNLGARARPRHPRLVRRRGRCPSRWRCATAREAHRKGGHLARLPRRRARAARDRAVPAGRARQLPGRRRSTASSTPTTCGSTSRRWPRRCASATACCRCR